MFGETVGLESQCDCSLNELLRSLTGSVRAELRVRVAITAAKSWFSWHRVRVQQSQDRQDIICQWLFVIGRLCELVGPNLIKAHD
jgi:hypothetical protein